MYTEKQRLACKKYFDSHKEERHKSYKLWSLKNKEKLLKKRKDYYLETKEKRRQEKRDWYFKNKIRILKKKREDKNIINKQLRTRRKTDINFKIRMNLRNRLWYALNGKNKSKRTIELLGCSIDFLKGYIEAQFKERMTWENYGTGYADKGMQEWHIDHIKECCSFDLSDPKQQEECFNYKNLRPLWASENKMRLKPKV